MSRPCRAAVAHDPSAPASAAPVPPRRSWIQRPHRRRPHTSASACSLEQRTGSDTQTLARFSHPDLRKWCRGVDFPGTPVKTSGSGRGLRDQRTMHRSQGQLRCVEVCPVDCIHPTPDEPDWEAHKNSSTSTRWSALIATPAWRRARSNAITSEDVVPPEWERFIKNQTRRVLPRAELMRPHDRRHMVQRAAAVFDECAPSPCGGRWSGYRRRDRATRGHAPRRPPGSTAHRTPMLEGPPVRDRPLEAPTVVNQNSVPARPAERRGMNRLLALQEAGVSIWLDTLSRELLDSGDFAALDRATARVTGRPRTRRSSPRRSPARTATTTSSRRSSASGARDPRELFFALALDDVRRAAAICCAPPTTQRRRATASCRSSARRISPTTPRAPIAQALELWSGSTGPT